MKVLFLHGSYGSPYVNWFPWLAEKLKGVKAEVYAPSFPTPKNQNYIAWKELLDYYDKQGVFTEDLIVVGHSCGSVCALKYLAEKNKKVKALILVAGYNNYLESDNPGIQATIKLNETFYADFMLFKNIEKNIPNRHSFYSSKDPYIPLEYFLKTAESINAIQHNIPEAGHFSEASNWTTFDALWDVIKSI